MYDTAISEFLMIKNQPSKKPHLSPDLLSKEKLDSLYKKHFRGALARAGAVFVMFIFFFIEWISDRSCHLYR